MSEPEDPGMPKPPDGTKDHLFSYAKCCLDYTFKSIQNEVHRIDMILGLSLVALGGNKYLLEQIEEATTSLHWALDWGLRAGVMVSSAVLFIILGLGVYWRRSRVIDETSPMLPENISKQKRNEYVETCRDQVAGRIIETVFRENHALAKAKTIRSDNHKHLSRLFVFAALLMIVVYAVLFFGRAWPT